MKDNHEYFDHHDHDRNPHDNHCSGATAPWRRPIDSSSEAFSPVSPPSIQCNAMQCSALYCFWLQKAKHCIVQCTEIQCAALHFGLKNAVQCIVFQCSLAQCTVPQLIAISEGFVYSSLYHLQSLLLDKIHICILIIVFVYQF